MALKALIRQVKQKKDKWFKRDEMLTKHEVNYMVEKKVKKALWKKQKCADQLHAFENMSVLESDQKYIDTKPQKRRRVLKIRLRRTI